MKAVRRNWYDVGEGLLGRYSSVLITIQRQHGSDKEAGLKAVIEAFLRGEGYYQPSWRRVIHALYDAGETSIAQDIISYAEPVEGERVCDSMLEQHTCGPARLQVEYIHNLPCCNGMQQNGYS